MTPRALKELYWLILDYQKTLPPGSHYHKECEKKLQLLDQAMKEIEDAGKP